MTAGRRKSKTHKPILEGEASQGDDARKINGSLSHSDDTQNEDSLAQSREREASVIRQLRARLADESCEERLRGSAASIVDAVIDRALAGDMPAVKMVLERFLPDPRNRLVSFDLRDIKGIDDAVAASADVLAALAQGKITLKEAEAVTKLIQNYIETNALREFAERLMVLEEVVKKYE